MKIIKSTLLVAAVLSSGPLMAETSLNTVPVDLSALPSEPRGVGTATAMVLEPDGHGRVMLRSFREGDITPPHRPRHEEVRLAVVVSGTIHHGLGDAHDPAAEVPYGPGSVLLMAATDTYWMAAREGDASIMFMFVPPEELNPALLEMMQ